MTITRKAATGEAGNPGEFGTLRRGESDVNVELDATAEQDAALTSQIELSRAADRLVSSARAYRDEQGFLAVDVALERSAMDYGNHHVARHDPADVTDVQPTRSEVDAEIEMVFDDPETFAEESAWPGEVSWDSDTSTIHLRTDERSASDGTDEDLLRYGVTEVVESLDSRLEGTAWSTWTGRRGLAL